MILYTKTFQMMKAKGLTTYKIRKNAIISESALGRLRRGESVTLDTIDRLCAALDCQPGDLLEYVPTPAEES